MINGIIETLTRKAIIKLINQNESAGIIFSSLVIMTFFITRPRKKLKGFREKKICNLQTELWKIK